MGVHKPTEIHKAFRTEMIALLNKHAGHLTAQDMLALASHLVGQVIAMQDKSKMSREEALKIVRLNIEQGNKEVVNNLIDGGHRT